MDLDLDTLAALAWARRWKQAAKAEREVRTMCEHRIRVVERNWWDLYYPWNRALRMRDRWYFIALRLRDAWRRERTAHRALARAVRAQASAQAAATRSDSASWVDFVSADVARLLEEVRDGE